MGNGITFDLAMKGLTYVSERLIALGEDEASSCAAKPEVSCPSCGNYFALEARFCPECGMRIEGDTPLPPPTGSPITTLPTPSVNAVSQTVSCADTPAERKEIYVGTIQKCPNCGGVVDPTDAVCDSCGFRIVGRSASTASQRFHEELLAIERRREVPKKEEGFLGKLVPHESYASQCRRQKELCDQQTLTLINTFPVPNTVEELSEFMFMAAGNINVDASKERDLLGSFFSPNLYEDTFEKAVSDAWVAKMQQMYRKAKVAFSDDPIFAHIHQIYVEKMTELNKQLS